jgi:insulysin
VAVPQLRVRVVVVVAAAAAAAVVDVTCGNANDDLSNKTPSNNLTVIRVVPVDETPQLNFSWSMPETFTEWRNKPFRLLSFCLGHEGPGSVLALLKSRGWANSLTAGCFHCLRDFSIFQCYITLTSEGFRHWRTIVHLVHRYLDIMKHGSQCEGAALFAELCLIEDASFKFQEKQTGETIAQSASIGMLEYPPEYCHFAQTAILDKDFRFEEWQRWLSHLCNSESNMRLHLIAPKELHEDEARDELQWLSERWYKTEYHTQPLLAALASDAASPSPISFAHLAALGAAADHGGDLHLPPSNPYLPTDFSMLPPESSGEPCPVLTADRAVTWATTEVSLKEPRTSLLMLLQVPWADADVDSYITNSLMIKIIEESFSTTKYLAEEARYEIQLTHQHSTCVTSGLRVSLLGFSDKFHAVLRDICAAIAAPLLSPDLFAYMIDTMQQTFDELKVSDAYSFCLRPGDHVRRRPWFSEAAKEQALQRITIEKLREVHAKFLRECFATIVICGNMSHAAAADVSKLALQALGIPIISVAPESATPSFTQAPHLALQVTLIDYSDPPFLTLSCTFCKLSCRLFCVLKRRFGRKTSPTSGDGHRTCLAFTHKPVTRSSVMLEYDLGILDDTKRAVASIVDKLFGRHIFQTLRTQMQVLILFMYIHIYPSNCCVLH